MEKKDFVVFKLSVANALVEQGFKIIGTGVNKKDPKYTIFYFEDTPELRLAIKLLTKKV